MSKFNNSFQEMYAWPLFLRWTSWPLSKPAGYTSASLSVDPYCNTYGNRIWWSPHCLSVMCSAGSSEILFVPSADSGVLITAWLWCSQIFGTFEGKRRRLLRSCVIFCCCLNLAQPKPVFRSICSFALVEMYYCRPTSAWWNVWVCFGDLLALFVVF